MVNKRSEDIDFRTGLHSGNEQYQLLIDNVKEPVGTKPCIHFLDNWRWIVNKFKIWCMLLQRTSQYQTANIFWTQIVNKFNIEFIFFWIFT